MQKTRKFFSTLAKSARSLVIVSRNRIIPMNFILLRSSVLHLFCMKNQSIIEASNCAFSCFLPLLSRCSSVASTLCASSLRINWIDELFRYSECTPHRTTVRPFYRLFCTFTSTSPLFVPWTSHWNNDVAVHNIFLCRLKLWIICLVESARALSWSFFCFVFCWEGERERVIDDDKTCFAGLRTSQLVCRLTAPHSANKFWFQLVDNDFFRIY